MIHVLTVHFRAAKWIRPQREYLERNISEPFQVWAAMPGVDPAYRSLVDHYVPSDGTHAGQLNLLAAHVCESADPDDWIWFLDGDAFPVSDPVPYVRKALESHDLVAIRRDENNGEKHPHPSFCAVTVRTWQELRGDWSDGHVWENARGELITECGANLLWLLRNRSWKPILRSNHTNLHPVWFGVYGGLIYHHGAGFRPTAVSQADYARFLRWVGRPTNRVGRALARRLQRRFEQKTVDRRTELSRQMYEKILSDPEFWRELSDGPEAFWC